MQSRPPAFVELRSAELPGGSGHDARISQLASDGFFLASVYRDFTIGLLDVRARPGITVYWLLKEPESGR